jgi:hypothetical protein
VKSNETFKATFDTMIYTVHSQQKNGEYSHKTRKEEGPRKNGFIIQISVLPIIPICAVGNQTLQRPYWKEYFWHGHRNTEKYIHFIFKFGKGVSEEFRKGIINIVTTEG